MNNIDAFSILTSINDDDIYSLIKDVTSSCFQEQDIFLGTKSGVVHKLENQRLNDDDELSFVTSLLGSLELSKNSPVDQMEFCGLSNLIVALVNESLIFIKENLLNIQPMNLRLKNVSALSVKLGLTVNDEYVTEMCVGLTNRRLQLYIISLDRLTLLTEITLSAVPRALSLSHDLVCVASSSAYSLVQISSGNQTELFSFDSSKVRPKIAQLSNDNQSELLMLLRGPDGLGVFADSNGASTRPPIQWGSTIRDFVALRSHIVAIDNEFITVHNISNQQQIQTIHFPNKNAFLVGSTATLLVIRNQQLPNWDIVQMIPLTWNQQASQYVSRGYVDKAISIVEKQFSRPNLSPISKQKCRDIFVVTGFHKFKQCNFKKAKLLMEKGVVDLRELINCYPDLLPKSYKFDPKISTIESGFQLLSIVPDDKDRTLKEIEFKQFLLELLLEHRNSSLTRDFSQIVETVLVKLYVELEPEKLFHNFTMMPTDVDYDDLVDYLTNKGNYHACAMVMQWYGQLDKAVTVWSRLIKKEISDPMFPGFAFLKDVLLNISDPNIIVKNIDWLLSLDPSSTSEILKDFIDRFKNEHDLINILVSKEAMSHIEDYPDTLFDILFELCQNGLLQNHGQHEHLSQIFMKKLLENRPKDQLFTLTRTKFQQFLTISDDYPTQKLLNQVREFPVPLLIEEALILGQMSEHEAALEIIVYQLHDFKFAEEFCLLFERKNNNSDIDLFLMLLDVYLSNKDPSFQTEFKDAALNLLERQAGKFNVKEVLTLLPNDWPLNRLRQFLLNSTAVRNQSCFTIKMKYSLESVVNQRKIREARGIIQNNKLVLEDWKQLLCSHCGDNIDNCSFIKTQNGKMLHKHCYNCA